MPIMVLRIALQILVALQLLLALAWPAQASTLEDLQHRALHTVLAQHGHDAALMHLDHEASHDRGYGHDHDLQLSNSPAPSEASGNISSDHHHHDFNISMALLSQYSKAFASGHCAQNPCMMPAMHSAELRAALRPPQA